MRVLKRFLIVIGCIGITVFTIWLAIQNQGTIMETILAGISGGVMGFLIVVVYGYFKERKYLKK